MTTYSVREWEPTVLASSIEELAPAVAYVNANAGECDLDVKSVPGGVRVLARGLVGVVPTAHGTLRIQPKIPSLNVLALVDYAERGVAWNAHEAAFREDDFVRLLGELFVKRAARLARRGWVHAYAERDDELRVLRGRLLVEREIRKVAGARSTMACRYEEFTLDVPANRVLARALGFVGGSGLFAPTVSRAARGLADSLHDVVPTTEIRAAFAQLASDKRFAAYHGALTLARLLLERGGLHSEHTVWAPAHAFILSLPGVFEAAVARATKRTASAMGLECRAQAEMPLDVDECMTIRPDVLVLRGGRPVFVLDAKYKAPESGLPPVSDFQQLVTYLGRLNLEAGAFIMPAMGGAGTAEPAVVRIDAFGRRLVAHVATVDLGGSAASVGAELEAACAALLTGCMSGRFSEA